MMDFSVIVCNYNGSNDDIEFTLKSLISQEKTDFELIFSDDGSRNNPSSFVENFFIKNNFSNYKLRIGKTNIGTVNALFEAVKLASGKYIKPIGVGDAFVYNRVLYDIKKFMDENNSRILFTGIIPFSWSGNKMNRISNFTIPGSTRCWKNNKYEKAKEHIVVFNDQISGASMFYENKYMKYLMNTMCLSTKYMEDLCQYIALLEGEKIFYYPKNCILYEFNTGISTNHSQSNMIRMKTDKNLFLDYLYKTYPNDRLLKRRRKLENLDTNKHNKILKGILKEVYEPKWIFFKLLKMKRK